MVAIEHGQIKVFQELIENADVRKMLVAPLPLHIAAEKGMVDINVDSVCMVQTGC